MAELSHHHVISQAYTLPFPYVCQIYHLLNLKHLEDVHSFSLNNLKVVGIRQFESTQVGGSLVFETALDSPVNLLRIWRETTAEIELVLHTPLMVELRVPVYGDKRINVVFNVLPLNHTEHKFFVDIYTNLNWPRPLLQLLFNFAACLTVLEDMPYLQRLTERNVQNLVHAQQEPKHDTMQLFRRFIHLHRDEAKQLKMVEPPEMNPAAE